MRYRNLKKIMMTLALWAGAVPQVVSAADLATSDALEERRRALTAREGEVARDDRDIERLQRFVGQLQDFRDNKLFGPKGLTTEINSWNDDFHTWADSWTAVDDSYSGLDEANAAQLLPAIQSQLKDRSQQLSSLITRAVAISEEAQRSKLALDDIDETTLKDQADVMRKLNARKADSLAVSDRITSTFNQQSFQMVNDALREATDTIRAKIKYLELHYPQLEQTLASARATLDFMESFSSRLYQVERDSEVVINAIGQYRLYAARSAMSSLTRSAATLKADMTASTAPDDIKNSALEQLKLSVSAAQDHLDRIAGESPAVIVSHYANSQRLIMSRDCRDPLLAPQRNCDLLRTMNALNLSISVLRTWSDADLAYLEGRLDKVAKPATWTKRAGK